MKKPRLVGKKLILSCNFCLENTSYKCLLTRHHFNFSNFKIILIGDNLKSVLCCVVLVSVAFSSN